MARVNYYILKPEIGDKIMTITPVKQLRIQCLKFADGSGGVRLSTGADYRTLLFNNFQQESLRITIEKAQELQASIMDVELKLISIEYRGFSVEDLALYNIEDVPRLTPVREVESTPDKPVQL